MTDATPTDPPGAVGFESQRWEGSDCVAPSILWAMWTWAQDSTGELLGNEQTDTNNQTILVNLIVVVWWIFILESLHWSWRSLFCHCPWFITLLVLRRRLYKLFVLSWKFPQRFPHTKLTEIHLRLLCRDHIRNFFRGEIWTSPGAWISCCVGRGFLGSLLLLPMRTRQARLSTQLEARNGTKDRGSLWL